MSTTVKRKSVSKSSSKSITKRLDKFGRFTPCSASEENVGRIGCPHLKGEEYLLSSWASEEDFFSDENNHELIKNLARKSAKENSKIKEEVPWMGHV